MMHDCLLRSETAVPWARIIVCGGRDFQNRDLLFRVLDEVHKRFPIEALIHGAARGADRLAGEWAADRKVPCIPVAADWQTYGMSAGPVRNKRMLKVYQPHIVVAFPGGRETDHMIKIARAAGVTVYEVKEEEA